MPGASVRAIVDRRSLRSFQNKLYAFVNASNEDALNASIEFAEEVLADSNSRIPVDTGAAASSAGYAIESAYHGARVRVGYALTSDPTNPRTGESVSAYLTTLHEDLTTPHSNGEAKFFETALMQHSESFISKGRERLAARLSGATVDGGPSRPVKHIDYKSPATSRIGAGFTASIAKGRYLPYPIAPGTLNTL